VTNDAVPVVCQDCETTVELEERLSDGLKLACDCPGTGIDVTECASGHNLLEPITGRWSTVDAD
jgi:hypothetical protein